MSDSLPTTANVHLVTAHQGHVLMMAPPRGHLSVQQALELAAWLVAMADCAVTDDRAAAGSVEDRFRAALAAVRDT